MKHVLVALCVLSASHAFSQWSQLPGPFGGQVFGFYQEGAELFASTDDGIFRSSDNGHFWARHPLNLPADIMSSKLLYKKGNLLFVQVQRSGGSVFFLYRSDDGGQTFDVQFDSAYAYTIAELGDTLYLSRGFHYNVQVDRRTLMRSTDHGLTWIEMAPPADNIMHLIADGKRLYAITYDYDRMLFEVWRSIDAGHTWATFKGVPPLDINSAGYRPSAIDVVAGNADTTLWIGFVQVSSNLNLPTVYYVSQHEDSLHAIDFLVDKKVEAIHHSPTSVYVSIPGLMLRYSIPEKLWIDITYNLEDFVFREWVGEFYPLPSGATDQLLISAKPTGRGIVRLDPSKEHYTPSDSGITLTMVHSILSVRDTLYTSCYSRDKHVYYSTDRGQHWQGIDFKLGEAAYLSVLHPTANGFLGAHGDSVYTLTGLQATSARSPGRPVEQFLQSGDSLFVRSSHWYYLSTDEGKSWKLRTAAPLAQSSRTATVLDGLLFAGSDGAVRSTDGAQTWETISFPFALDLISISCTDGANIFAAGRLQNGTEYYYGVVRSPDRGQSWQVISSPLPDQTFFYSMAATNGLVLCGTALGVFVGGTNAGGPWQEFALGRGVGYNITYDKENIYVGTWRSGIWKASIAELKALASVTSSPVTARVAQVTTYPNPTTGNLLLDVDASYASIEILDLTGRVVLRSGFRESYDVGALSAGVYHVNVLGSDRTVIAQAKFTKD